MGKPFKEVMAEQERFDALVSLRLERSGETLESAIAWAREFVARTEAKTPEPPKKETVDRDGSQCPCGGFYEEANVIGDWREWVRCEKCNKEIRRFDD